uniref:Uncharacterized protein n=1 Tax=Myripristis murdjan TaxID=586833 RepID=A0A667Y484_9TELE
MDLVSSVFGSIAHWVDIQSLLLFTVLFLLIADYLKTRRPSSFPPGPWALPFVGNIFTVDFNRTYGDVYSLRMGQTWMVVLNGFQIVKEALVTQGDSLADRPILPFQVDMFLNLAGPQSEGKPFNPHLIINNAVSNMICSLIVGHRFEYEDERFIKLIKRFDSALQSATSIWAQASKIHFNQLKMTGQYYTFRKCARLFFQYFMMNIFVYSQRKGDAESTFSEENLVICALDLFVAGSETTSTTLRWAFLYMAKYPEIQEKVQAEIDRVIGQSRKPSMMDRANLPYTDAVIHEIQRMGNIVPLSLRHSTNRDIQLGDYTVPKGVVIIPNLTSVLFDKREWETPYTFNPGHFLNEEGKFVKRAAFIPFSAGKRVCLGENLARMEIFLFFTSFMQRFTISVPAGTKLVLDFCFGFTLARAPYEICATLCRE